MDGVGEDYEKQGNTQAYGLSELEAKAMDDVGGVEEKGRLHSDLDLTISVVGFNTEKEEDLQAFPF